MSSKNYFLARPLDYSQDVFYDKGGNLTKNKEYMTKDEAYETQKILRAKSVICYIGINAVRN